MTPQFKPRTALRTISALALLALTLTLFAGCQDKSRNTGSNNGMSTDMSMSSASLYDRLGGEPAIIAVVDDFVTRAAADPRVNITREGHPSHWDPTPENVDKLKDGVAQFIAQATGGPQEYHGKDMATLHKGMDVTSAEFDAAGEHLKAALDHFHVGAREQQELLDIVETTRADIVQSPDAPTPAPMQ